MNVLDVALAGSARQVPLYLQLFAFRVFPMAVWGLRSVTVPRWTRAGMGALLLAMTATGVLGQHLSLAQFALIPACYVYAAGVAVATRAFCAEPEGTWPQKIPAFLFAVSLGLVIPKLLVPAALLVPFLVLGWDLVFKVYSYCLDVGASRAPVPLSRCLFFFCVDPSLIFATGARPYVSSSQDRRRHLLRAMLGCLVMVLGAGMRAAALALHGGREPAQLSWTASIASSALVFLALYALHSGLASLQIGSLGVLGVRVAERYRYPFLARDLPDFWTRWNTYVGQWFARYLFNPVCMMWLRRVSSKWAPLAKGGAVLVTFLAIGIAHTIVYPDSLRHLLYRNGVFVFIGVAVCVNYVVRRLGERLRATFLTMLFGRTLLTAVVLSTVWSWM